MYQVTAECVYATVETVFGRAKTLVMRGGVLPEGTPELKHLIDSGMVEKIGGPDGGGVNALGGLGPAESAETAAGSVVSSSPPAPAPAPDVETKRAEARAKLPADGSAPAGNASHDVWVEYAVLKGMDRAEAEKASRDDLRDALK